jgi:hypothetical protein
VPTTLICPDCNAVATVHLDRDVVRVDYSYDQWWRQCVHPGAVGMSTCPGVETVMQLLLTQLRRPPEPDEGDPQA